jgi:hypothetical protein
MNCLDLKCVKKTIGNQFDTYLNKDSEAGVNRCFHPHFTRIVYTGDIPENLRPQKERT